MVISDLFGYSFKQILYTIGGIITIVATATSIYILYVAKKLPLQKPQLSEKNKLKAQLDKLESKRKDIAYEIALFATASQRPGQSIQTGGLNTKMKKKIVSIKHQMSKTAKKADKLALSVPKVEAIEGQEDTKHTDDTPIKPFDAVRTGKSKFTMKYWKNHFLEKFHPETTALINMELMNGFHRLFIVKEKDEGFNYRNRKYLFDNEAKYYIIDTKLWCYDFHENFTLPIRRKIPLTAIKKSLEHSNISEVEYATNPSTLERFTISKIAEGIMKGQAIDDFMKQIRLLLIIAMLSSLIHLVLFMFKSGMLQQIKIPGVTG